MKTPGEGFGRLGDVRPATVESVGGLALESRGASVAPENRARETRGRLCERGHVVKKNYSEIFKRRWSRSGRESKVIVGGRVSNEDRNVTIVRVG